MSITLPDRLIAGDTLTASADVSDYPASDGWAATLSLVGASAAPTTQAGVASGSAFTFTIAGAATSNLAAGTYAGRIQFTKAGSRHTVDAGAIVVQADPTASATRLRDTMGPWARTVMDLEAAYQDYVTSGKVGVASYTINGRAMQYSGIDKIIIALDRAKHEARKEAAAAGQAVESSRFVVRM